jgi:AcrR family transcriptional regulator
MRRVQEAALELFDERGYDEVTIEQIAARADVGPATVYRNFGTKERIVLWDEYDPELFAAIEARLPGTAVRRAVLDAVAAELDRVYAADSKRILRRARLIRRHPALVAASAADLAAMRRALAALLLARRAAKHALEADVVAGAIVGTLEAAIEHWVQGRGKTPLRQVLRRAFDCLDALA